ncbi:EVE domain-containing protein [Shewanella sp. 5_MG-2023]|uniref:EVE domain-containing protein n=1 Tax=unclassified Shewanella TaxID=196818 RepID=UPI0026E2436F|nr:MULTISPECIES: EVE domain-containing protein [unclassified Shewanella]MDO6640406.1 EVE domain-containing protein [Shewanella sp. 5_MG-2023]MDO6775246.1 EVE domain-containing protein [Shewanella sp. 3_MG-2023]
MKYWLMKSEPDEFSIDDLAACLPQSEPWQGIRNYQARNFLRDEVKTGDLVLFYHSSCKVPAVVGIAEVTSDAVTDLSAFDNQSPYFDPKSDKQKPRWVAVDIRFIQKLTRIITLAQLKADPKLADMVLVSKGARLSVQPVTEEEFNYIVAL